jgi:two-component system nitrogen regulation sensor histidine kinase NtrY
LLAVLWSRQVSRPVERLAAFSERLAHGEWDEPLALRSVRELETLVSALDRMRLDLRQYRKRLITSERQAAWSQMARKVAHEVKNPLTPIAISVADLKRSYEQKRPDFPAILDQAVRTVEEEVETLRSLLQEFSDYGRFPAPRMEPFHASDLVADLEALYARETATGRIEFSRPGAEVVLPADRGQIRQALINLVKNGLEATEEGGRVTVAAGSNGSALEITVADTGPGLTSEQRANLFVPGFTTKPGGSGLGLTIVERIVSDHQGAVSVEDNAPHGTLVRIRLPLAGRESP